MGYFLHRGYLPRRRAVNVPWLSFDVVTPWLCPEESRLERKGLNVLGTTLVALWMWAPGPWLTALRRGRASLCPQMSWCGWPEIKPVDSWSLREKELTHKENRTSHASLGKLWGQRPLVRNNSTRLPCLEPSTMAGPKSPCCMLGMDGVGHWWAWHLWAMETGWGDFPSFRSSRPWLWPREHLSLPPSLFLPPSCPTPTQSDCSACMSVWREWDSKPCLATVGSSAFPFILSFLSSVFLGTVPRTGHANVRKADMAVPFHIPPWTGQSHLAQRAVGRDSVGGRNRFSPSQGSRSAAGLAVSLSFCRELAGTRNGGFGRRSPELGLRATKSYWPRNGKNKTEKTDLLWASPVEQRK